MTFLPWFESFQFSLPQMDGCAGKKYCRSMGAGQFPSLYWAACCGLLVAGLRFVGSDKGLIFRSFHDEQSFVYLDSLSRQETPNSVKTKCNVCVTTLYVSTLCVTALYVSTLCVTALYVSTLCVTALCEHSMCDRSM